MAKINDPLTNLAQSYCVSRGGAVRHDVDDVLATIIIGITLALKDPELAKRLLLRTLEAGGLAEEVAAAKIETMGRTALLATLAKEA